MSKILVTGGAGYIGSQTNLELIKQGFETIVFDNLVYGYKEFVPKESTLVIGDLLNKEDIRRVFENNEIAGVIHFAAFINVGESVENPRKYYENNVLGTFNLLNTMLDFGVKNLVFSSTCATYGLPEKVPITEEEKQLPINPYGQGKLTVERILNDYYEAYDFHSIALRYFNACGADPELRTGEDHQPETHLIPLILQTALGMRDSIKIFGQDYKTPDGTCIRDYIHTMDLATSHVSALRQLLNGVLKFEQINIGTGQGYSVKEIIEKAKQITGLDFPVEIVERRPGDPDQLVADNSKARNLLNWEPEYSNLDNIIQTAWNWTNKRFSKK